MMIHPAYASFTHATMVGSLKQLFNNRKADIPRVYKSIQRIHVPLLKSQKKLKKSKNPPYVFDYFVILYPLPPHEKILGTALVDTNIPLA
jgi:hypothetical protein